MHEVVDTSRWKRLFPLDALRAEGEREMKAVMKHSPEFFQGKRAIEREKAFYAPWAEPITGPYHLAVIEQYRDERAANLIVPERVETDVFVFAKGEPKTRAVTKVGGLPYWPKNRDWPCGKDGDPLTFLAQVCFADSHDLVGALPGDVLAHLIHAPLAAWRPTLCREPTVCLRGFTRSRAHTTPTPQSLRGLP